MWGFACSQWFRKKEKEKREKRETEREIEPPLACCVDNLSVHMYDL